MGDVGTRKVVKDQGILSLMTVSVFDQFLVQTIGLMNFVLSFRRGADFPPRFFRSLFDPSHHL
jgi:hypothetical protein